MPETISQSDFQTEESLPKMPIIVEMIDDVISAIDPVAKTAPDAKINAVKAEVNKMMKDYPLFAW